MQNPFLQEHKRLDVRDLRNALSDIKSDLVACQGLIEESERSGRIDSEVQMVMALSGLEIKMSNFAKAMREKFL